MKRIIFSSLLSATISALSLGANAAFAQITQPFMWELTKGDKTVTLFGSLHVGKTDFYPLPESVLKRFDAAKVLAVEADVTLPDTQLACDKIAASTEPLDKVMPVDDYNGLMGYIKATGINEKLIEKRQLWMINLILGAIELAQLGVDFTKGLDIVMINEARVGKKKIVEIEGGVKQCSALASATQAEAIASLQRFLTSIRENKMESRLNAMMTAYRSGDGAALLKVINDEYGTSADGLRSKKRFLEARHPFMAEVIDGYFAKPDSHFVAVGVGHMLGDNSLLQALEKRGVKVKRL